MAKFRYRMQNILDIKEKMENQAKTAYGMANAKTCGRTAETSGYPDPESRL